MIDVDKFHALASQGDWTSLYDMLDGARDNATSRDDIGNEVQWRIAALKRQQRYDEALSLLRSNANIFNCQSYVRHQSARILVQLGREEDALNELSKAPFDSEMTAFYAMALDTKFFYFYLMARAGDASVRDRLSEIPDDYEHITGNIEFLTKSDIVAALSKS